MVILVKLEHLAIVNSIINETSVLILIIFKNNNYFYVQIMYFLILGLGITEENTLFNLYLFTNFKKKLIKNFIGFGI